MGRSVGWDGTAATPERLFCPALAALWGERRWILMVVTFGAFIAFIYILFVLILNVPLP